MYSKQSEGHDVKKVFVLQSWRYSKACCPIRDHLCCVVFLYCMISPSFIFWKQWKPGPCLLGQMFAAVVRIIVSRVVTPKGESGACYWTITCGVLNLQRAWTGATRLTEWTSEPWIATGNNLRAPLNIRGLPAPLWLQPSSTDRKCSDSKTF